MKNTIEYLNKDRKVNKTFMAKLEKVGLEIQYGKYSYWDNREYVQIGRKKVWLVCEGTAYGSSHVKYRYQNNVISDIYEAVREETEKAEKADKQVEEFFKKLGLETDKTNAIDPELIEILRKKILNQEEFDFVSEHEQVVGVENCGMSGRYPDKVWYSVKLVNGEEYSIY